MMNCGLINYIYWSSVSQSSSFSLTVVPVLSLQVFGMEIIGKHIHLMSLGMFTILSIVTLSKYCLKHTIK